MTELKAESLALTYNSDNFDFKTTEEVQETTTIIGQERLSSAVEFGIELDKDGYNIFALGPQETNKQEHIEHFIREKAKHMPVPRDITYVNNFDENSKPKVLTLPAGRGCKLCDLMEDLVEDLVPTLTSAFETEEYQNRKQSLRDTAQAEEEEALEDVKKEAEEKGFRLIRTPTGLSLAPTKDGDLMKESDVQELPEEERTELQENLRNLQKEMQKVIRQMPSSKRQIRKQIRELDKEIASFAIKELFKEVHEEFSDLEKVQKYLEEVEKDIIENVQSIRNSQAQGQSGGGLASLISQQAQQQGQQSPGSPDENPILDRYKVNLLIDHCDSEGAPVVYENNPSFKNLIGRVEHQPRMGALTTNFNLIKPGALHKANGGYLILDAHQLLLEPFAWEGLKRVLTSGKLKIESMGQSYSAISTVTLEPEPMDLDVKVILAGERMLYYLLYNYDPDFKSLFKVEADFEDEIDSNEDNYQRYVRLLAGLIRKNDLRHFDKDAVIRVLEQSARMVGDRQKLSTMTEEISDLLREANYWAGKRDAETVMHEDVQKAIEQQRFRSGRIRDKVYESINRDFIFIDTTGTAIGQVNGLSVAQIGHLMFGRPNRISARVQLGKGEIIDIEREVKMSGPIHSKGILILKGFLGERYAQDRPLSLSASLVFEQSYSNIDGDSASSAELYVLLSAIGDIPIKQSLSVTGSVNQHGKIQPIGGVNEKIEGFFHICKQRRLTGEQGVIIPKANEKNLLLHQDVIKAVKAGQFHIYSVDTIDEGMELLTGMEMGQKNDSGQYPEDTINARIISRLNDLAEKRKTFITSENGKSDND